MNKYREDTEIYQEIPPEDRWIYNKYDIAIMQGLKCGVGSVRVSISLSIIRPMINLHGMSRGTETNASIIPPGHFWCEYLKGNVITIDFVNGKRAFASEGVRDESGVDFESWTKVPVNKAPEIKSNEILNMITKYKYFNIEMIGDKVIEAHPMRHNPDWVGKDHIKKLLVIKKISDLKNHNGQFFYEPDHKRVGFLGLNRIPWIK